MIFSFHFVSRTVLLCLWFWPSRGHEIDGCQDKGVFQSCLHSATCRYTGSYLMEVPCIKNVNEAFTWRMQSFVQKFRFRNLLIWKPPTTINAFQKQILRYRLLFSSFLVSCSLLISISLSQVKATERRALVVQCISRRDLL